MPRLDKPTILESIVLALYRITPDNLTHHWPDSVKTLNGRENARQIRLHIAEMRRKEKGRKLRINSHMEAYGKHFRGEGKL
jgi:hypothetical protein